MGRSKRNSENWLLTYSDFVTLLLVFFVLLYLLTPGVDQSTFDNFISFFQRSIGIIDESAVVDRETLKKRLMEEWQTIEQILKDMGLEDEVELEEIPEGVKITISNQLTFDSGSSDLRPEAEEILQEIAVIFDEEIVEMEVQGHTDTVPISENSHYQTNWHLGASRAVSVVQFIRTLTNLEPEKFKASSYGEYVPIASNQTAEGRRKNRRVEIYVRYEALAVQPLWFEPEENVNVEENSIRK